MSCSERASEEEAEEEEEEGSILPRSFARSVLFVDLAPVWWGVGG